MRAWYIKLTHSNRLIRLTPSPNYVDELTLTPSYKAHRVLGYQVPGTVLGTVQVYLLVVSTGGWHLVPWYLMK